MAGLDLGILPDGQGSEGKKSNPWLVYAVGAVCTILTHFIEVYEKDKEAKPCADMVTNLMIRNATLTDNQILYLQKHLEQQSRITDQQIQIQALQQALKEKSK